MRVARSQSLVESIVMFYKGGEAAMLELRRCQNYKQKKQILQFGFANVSQSRAFISLFALYSVLLQCSIAGILECGRKCGKYLKCDRIFKFWRQWNFIEV